MRKGRKDKLQTESTMVTYNGENINLTKPIRIIKKRIILTKDEYQENINNYRNRLLMCTCGEIITMSKQSGHHKKKSHKEYMTANNITNHLFYNVNDHVVILDKNPNNNL